MRPYIGAGGTLGVGQIEEKRVGRDPYCEYGLELQLGIATGGKWLANRAFASVAYVDDETWRFGLGYNIAAFAWRAAHEPGRGALLIVIPQQMEVTWAADRLGVTFSYGF